MLPLIPSALQRIPIHMDEYSKFKREKERERVTLKTVSSIEEAFSSSSETQTSEDDVRSWAGITCHLEKDPRDVSTDKTAQSADDFKRRPLFVVSKYLWRI